MSANKYLDLTGLQTFLNKLDNRYVDKTNNQTIAGIKTFTSRPKSAEVYTKLQYIQSTAASGFPYIRTGVLRGVHYTDKLTCVLDGYFSESQNSYGFCGYDSGGQLGQKSGKWSTENDGLGTTNVNCVGSSNRATVTQVLDFANSTNKLYIGDTMIAGRSINNASFSQQADYPLFVAYNGTYTYQPAKLVLCSFKMYAGDTTGTLIRDFIPVRNANDEVGLLDLVENKFYRNQGTISFVAGSDVEVITVAGDLLVTSDVGIAALTNSYNDLDDKPTISNSTITIKQTGISDQTFTLNGSATTITLNDTTYSNATTSAAGLMSATDKTKLNGIATGAEVNVQSDWNVTDSASDAYIKNKPTIPAAITITTTSGSESISDGTNTLSFGSNAFNSTTIPTTYIKSASSSGNTLTLTKQDNTTETFTPSFTESDTLATVTGRGAITSTAVTMSGGLDVTGNNLKLNKISAPTTSGGSTYGTGSSGQVLKADGSGQVYWASDSNTNYYPIRSYTSGLQISTYSGSTNCQLYVPNASSSQAGVVTTEAQTFAGVKSFNNGIKLLETSSYYATLQGDSSASSNITLTLPSLTGTLALVSDIPEGDVDVTINGTATSTVETLNNIIVGTTTYKNPTTFSGSAGTTGTPSGTTTVPTSSHTHSVTGTVSVTATRTTTGSGTSARRKLAITGAFSNGSAAATSNTTSVASSGHTHTFTPSGSLS